MSAMPFAATLGVGRPIAVGMKEVSRPCASTIVHCVIDGQPSPDGEPGASIVTRGGAELDVGSKLTARPAESTSVHCVFVVHAKPSSRFP